MRRSGLFEKGSPKAKDGKMNNVLREVEDPKRITKEILKECGQLTSNSLIQSKAEMKASDALLSNIKRLENVKSNREKILSTLTDDENKIIEMHDELMTYYERMKEELALEEGKYSKIFNKLEKGTTHY